jgi:hypothetical protein
MRGETAVRDLDAAGRSQADVILALGTLIMRMQGIYPFPACTNIPVQAGMTPPRTQRDLLPAN